jgi:hypothetical protein
LSIQPIGSASGAFTASDTYLVEVSDSWNSMDVVLSSPLSHMVHSDEVAVGEMIRIKGFSKFGPDVRAKPEAISHVGRENSS